jgi:hypothetical protein
MGAGMRFLMLFASASVNVPCGEGCEGRGRAIATLYVDLVKVLVPAPVYSTAVKLVPLKVDWSTPEDSTADWPVPKVQQKYILDIE